MKKALLVTAALAVALSFATAAAEDHGKVVTIGTHFAGNTIPWYGGLWDSCRFQCLWFKSDINYAGYVNAVEFEKTDATSGRFDSVRVWLCHSRNTTLEPTFADNYTGYTPLEVLNMRSLTVSGTGWFDLRIIANRFNYDNKRNLLMEVRWNADDGYDVPCWRSGQPYSRCYAYDHNATQGTVYNTGQRIRLHIGTMVGVEATSLGRVKTLFR